MANPVALEITESHEALVGEVTVRRALPRHDRRTIGAWCFADHMGPVAVTEERGLDIGPHPHTGLQTVTWLLEGEELHRDSLGTEQLIQPGQLNLMTAGNGVAHAEEATGRYQGSLQGIQLWIAQPEATRHGPAAFEHHRELPQVDLGIGEATVLVGSYAGATSPARHDTELVGVDLSVQGSTTLELEPSFEYGLVVLVGAVELGGGRLTPGHLGYLAPGRAELGLLADGGTRALLLGGPPFDEKIMMWWNFVARSRLEFEEAARSWETDDGRFGQVGSTLARLASPPLQGEHPQRGAS